MSHRCSYRKYIATTMSAPTPTPTPLPDPRKLANKRRRTAGRERHEERKTQTKDIAYRRQCESIERRPGLQERLLNQGTLAFTGRGLDNVRTLASHIRDDSDTDTDMDDYEVDEIEDVVPQTRLTSGAALLAMARPAKTRRPLPQTTDGEAFEIVEIDGRFVAFDEDGWEILPDESAGPSFLYSEIVRGDAR